MLNNKAQQCTTPQQALQANYFHDFCWLYATAQHHRNLRYFCWRAKHYWKVFKKADHHLKHSIRLRVNGKAGTCHAQDLAGTLWSCQLLPTVAPSRSAYTKSNNVRRLQLARHTREAAWTREERLLANGKGSAKAVLDCNLIAVVVWWVHLFGSLFFYFYMIQSNAGAHAGDDGTNANRQKADPRTLLHYLAGGR